MFDYSELLGKIKTVFKTQEAFSVAMGMSLTAINQRLNNKIDWSTPEMVKACDVLGIELIDVAKYFFSLKVQ